MGYDPRARRELGSAPLEVTRLGLGRGPLGGFRAAIADASHPAHGTLLEQGALDELLPLRLEKRIGILAGGPYNSGILATGPGEDAPYNYQAVPPGVLQRVRRIDAVCRRDGVALAAAALQFPLAHPAISALIPGAVSGVEVLQNLDHCGSTYRPISGRAQARGPAVRAGAGAGVTVA